MRAATYSSSGDVDVIALRVDLPEPEIGLDDVLVAIAYAGLNRADVLERKGLYPMPPALVRIPGMEFSGVVQRVGSRVTGLEPGDRVCGLTATGAHAELLACNALTLSKVPDRLSLSEAAAIPEAFITAHDALFAHGAFALGHTVLVHAVGSSVGLACVGLAKHTSGVVIGTSRTPEKLSRASAHGLDHGVLLDDSWPSKVLALTGGRGVDLVLDFLGASALDRNVMVLASKGRIVQIGTLTGSVGPFNLGPLMFKRASVHGTVLRSRLLDERILLARTFSLDVLPLFARGELRAEVDRVFPLERLGDAHAYMESNANFGKIVIEIGGG